MTTTKKKFPFQNGQITIKGGWPLAFRTFTIHGGPFASFNQTNYPDTLGVCLRAEAKPKHEDSLWLPIKDFSVPNSDSEVEQVLRAVLGKHLRGQDVYVGCMGGWGRTGLMLSLIAKTLGAPDPVEFVRVHYSDRAVETEAQAAYVDEFDVSGLRRMLMFQTWWSRVPFVKG